MSCSGFGGLSSARRSADMTKPDVFSSRPRSGEAAASRTRAERVVVRRAQVMVSGQVKAAAGRVSG